MKNLIKNVLRSFKNNKISIIGLIFLLFFGLGVFATMSNTTANIRNEYTSLAERGKLHDFTASELYDVGSASYLPYTKGISYDYQGADVHANWRAFVFNQDEVAKTITTTQLYPGNTLVSGQAEARTYYIPVPEQTIFTGEQADTVIRTYHLILDKDSSTGLYQNFALNHPGSEYVDFYYKVIKTYQRNIFGERTVPQKVIDYQTILNNWNQDIPQLPTVEQIEDMAGRTRPSIFSDDYQGFAKFMSEHTQNVFSVMTTTDTPLVNKIHSDYENEVEARFFKSINVTATEDKVYYKIIDSNPTDTIDTMVLFSDPVGRYGNKLFDNTDWQPYGSEVIIYDLNDEPIKPGTPIDLPSGDTIHIPDNFNEIVGIPILDPATIVGPAWSGEEGKRAKWIYSQILHIRFKRMLAGDRSTLALDACLEDLAAPLMDIGQYTVQLFTTTSSVYKAYQDYYSYWYGLAAESITISTNGNVVFIWIEPIVGTPQTCTISNWTSRFSIVNPQHLEKNNKRVLDPSILNNFAPFREWYKVNYKHYPNGEIKQKIAATWFNTLTQNQLNFWINPYTKADWSSMSYDVYGIKTPIVVQRGKGSGQWSGIDKQFIADCGGYNQIIWGCGLTPDFMYPVVDITRPTPNTKTECLVYCNDAGYQTIKLAFVNSTVEEYLLARFKANVNTNRRHEIVNEINDWATKNMIFPDNVKSAYFANDTSNLLNCSGFRVSYIPNLVSVIQIVTTILCSFIGILCLIICFVIIKRYVENNRVNIGIMRANGIKKWKIGVSMLPFAFFPALIGGIAAYVTGLFLQAPALSLFKNYWMLPTPLIKFDWVSFLASIFLPFLIFGLICFVATLLVLRVSSVELMKSGSEFKTNSFSRIVKKPFKHFGVLTRFRVALAFNSITRLLMLATMSCLTMSSLVFAFTTFDKLNTSRITNSTQFDYKFNVELTTPTASGSIYSLYDYSANSDKGDGTVKGFGWSDPTQYSFNDQWDTSDWADSYETMPEWGTVKGENYYPQLTKWYAIPSMLVLDNGYVDAIGANGNLMLPTMNDATGQDIDLLYLQNKTCSRLTLDYNMGVPGIGTSNPWEIALALMPSNSRNIAADSFNSIVEKVGQYVADAQKAFSENDGIKELVNAGQVTPEGSIYADNLTTTFNIAQTTQRVRTAEVEAGKWCSVYTWDEGIGTYWHNYFPTYFVFDEETQTYSLDTNIGTVGNLGMAFKTSFVDLIRTIYTDKELMQLEYPITYGGLPINWDRTDDDKKDETYTYITANIKSLSNKHRFDSTDEISIEGITQGSKYIKLTDKKGNDLNSWLFSENYLKTLGIDGNIHPLVANAYAAHKYGLKIGTEIKISATNSVNRYDQLLHADSFEPEDNQAIFKVVGVSQGTNNAAFYTTQTIANDILGLPNGRSWNKTHKYMMWSSSDWGSAPSALPQIIDLAGVGSDEDKTAIYKFSDGESFVDKPIIDRESVSKLSACPVPMGFNGVYTENTSGKPITAGLSLYSYTGMYPGTSVYKSNGNNKFEQILSYGANLSIANLLTGVDDPEVYKVVADHLRYPSDQQITAKFQEKIIWMINKLVDVYGDTTMVTAICGAMDVAASDLIYNNLISTFDLAETGIMAIIIPITIIIVAIISNLIINDSKKMSAMLKALGYSDAKNLMSILALFVPTIILGLGLAVPLSFGLTLGYQSIIFSSANILIDVTQKWWYYIAAVGGIGAILIATYAIGYVSIKRARLVDEIK